MSKKQKKIISSTSKEETINKSKDKENSNKNFNTNENIDYLKKRINLLEKKASDL